MYPYQNTALTPEERAADLCSRLTLREKVGQLNQRLHGFDSYTREGETFSLSDEFIRENYHMPKTLSRQFWVHFAAAYFGTDRPLSSIEEEIRPYAGLKTIIIEREAKCPMPEFRAALSTIL